MLHRRLITLSLLCCLIATTRALADTIESIAGSKIEGRIIARDDKFITIEVQLGGKPYPRKYPMNLVRAVTIDGKREVIQANPAPSAATPGAKLGTQAPANAAKPAAAGAGAQLTRAEIEKLIQAGATPPEWFESTTLNLPKSLDLSWPDKPEGNWNNQRNVGQFIWDVINPNERRWPEGIKLMRHLMDLHKGSADHRNRAAQTLGSMYHNLFQDYARAAYWWRQAGDRQDYVGLAECYWKLGSKQMAVDMLGKLRQVPPAAVKLWADMGETDKALQLAKLFERSNAADLGYLYAGDACRLVGRYPEALAYYEKVLAIPDDDRNKRNKERARGNIEAIRLFDTLDLAKVKDGAYSDSSLGYEAPITVEVKVAGGKIADVKVTQHREKQYYAAITDTTTQIIKKQSVKGIDATSRATITSDAIVTAAAKALQKGQQGAP